MNMLSDEEERFHATRESYSQLSDVEWSAVERMSSIVGEHAVCAMLSSLDSDEQHAVIVKFIQQELDVYREKVILLLNKLSC